MSDVTPPRIPKSTWIVGAILALVALVFVASGGVPGFFIGIGLIALVSGLYAVVSGRKSWALLPTRKIASIVAAAGLVTVMVGGGLNGPRPADDAPHALETTAPIEAPATTPSAKPSASAKPTASASPMASAKPTASPKASEPPASTAPVPLVAKPEGPVQSVEPAPAPPAAAPAAPPPPPPAPSVYYKNCDAVRAAGAAPIYLGDPGYAKHLDRDNDGIGCE